MNEVSGLFKLDWLEISALLAAIGTIGTFLAWIGRMLMSRNFVSHAEHIALGGRMSGIAQQIERLATRDELLRLEGRVGPMETGIAVLGEQVKGVKEAVVRTEHMVQMLVNHQLDTERQA